MSELLSWVAVVELPVFAALFRMAVRQKKEHDEAMSKNKEALSEFKLHVARNYASMAYMKDVENRLTDHLLRIEKKLDYVRKDK